MGLKNFESWKIIGYEKIKKKLGPKKNVCLKKFVCPKKNLGLEKIWVSEKILLPKNIGSQKIYGPKKLGVGSCCFFLFFFFLWHWKTKSTLTSSSSVEFQVGLEFDKVTKINWIRKNLGSRKFRSRKILEHNLGHKNLSPEKL